MSNVLSRVNDFYMGIASRGYGWYLALKIAKAMWCPLAFVLVVVLAIVGGALMFLFLCVKQTKDAALLMAGVFLSFFEKRWFTGFSRAHYRSLRHYQKPQLIPRKNGGTA